MEVSLVQADGIPEGCIVSVRAGTTRRQAPVEANKPCKLLFPKGVSYANPFKVDLLAPLGESTFEVTNAEQKYPFEVKSRYGGRSMHVTLRVREDGSKAAALENEMDVGQSIGDSLNASVAGETSAHRHKAAIEQREYFDAHNLLSWMETLMKDLARHRPDDPWTYIDASTAKARLKPKSSSAPPAKSAAAEDLSKGSSEEVFAPAEDMEVLRAKAKAALTPGKLQAALQQCKEAPGEAPKAADDIQALRAKAKAALKPAKLEAALKQCKEPSEEVPAAAGDIEALRAKAKAALKPGKLEAALQECKGPEEVPSEEARSELASKAKAALGEMLSNGKLDAALDAAIEKRKAPSPEASAPAAEEEERLRAQAKSVLTQGALSGKLTEAMNQVKNENVQEIEALRSKAKSLFTQGAASGKLESAVLQCKQATDAEEELQMRAADALLRKGRPGLKKILTARDRAPIEDIRRRVALSLLAAADDGSLMAAVVPGIDMASFKQCDFSRVSPGHTLRSPRPETSSGLRRMEEAAAEVTSESSRIAKITQGFADMAAAVEARNPAAAAGLLKVATDVAAEEAARSAKVVQGLVDSAVAVKVTNPAVSAGLARAAADLKRANTRQGLTCNTTEAQEQSDLNELRNLTMKSLLDASIDGTLVTTLQEVARESESPVAASRPQAEPKDSLAPAREAPPIKTEQCRSAPVVAAKGSTSSPATAPPLAASPKRSDEVSVGIVGRSKSQSGLKSPLAPLQSTPKVLPSREDARLRFMESNEALRRENVRLKRLREAGDAANSLCSENDKLREELGKLFTLGKKDPLTKSSGSIGIGYAM